MIENAAISNHSKTFKINDQPFLWATSIHVVWIEIPKSSQFIAAHLDDLTTTGLQVLTNTPPLGAGQRKSDGVIINI